jgi:hypothetical protein
MKVFAQIDPTAGDSTLRDGCQAIVTLARQMRVTNAAWSLAELGADDDDLCWLLDWAHSLDESLARRWLQQSSFRAAFGSLLLLLAAEYARRALPRETPSDVVPPFFFPPSVRACLFRNGEPSADLLRALFEAAQRLNLRCASVESAAYDLIGQPMLLALQFGFTEPEAYEWLPRWLSGEAPPAAVLALLDPQIGSRSFQSFWQSCLDFQRGQLTSEQFRQRLEETPWCLPSWIEPLLAAISKAMEPPAAPVQLNVNASGQQPLDIFAALDADESQPVIPMITEAIRAINAHADARRLGRERWSLAELQPSDYDFIWLRVWVKRLDAATINECATGDGDFSTTAGKVKLHEALGCLLLLWLSETARRKAVEGELWPYVADGHFEAEAQSLLFTQGQPSRLLREMLQAAVERFYLRHVLNETSVQRWLDTVFLQFGVSARGFKDRLPEWLTRQATTRAIESLLDDRGGSASFRQLWEELRAYRRNQITESRLRTTLESSPWILPEWIEKLISSAQASNAAAAAISPPRPDSFLTAPVLHWPPGSQPQFVTQITADLSPLRLTEDCYDLRIGGRLAAQLLRQADDSYLPVPSRVIVLDFDQPSIIASLVNSQGETIKSDDLELWPADEDVTVYRLPSGERLPDAFNSSLSPNVSYALLTAADLTIEPQPQEWRLADSQCVKIYRLPANWPSQTQMLLDGELLWEPNIRQRNPEPPWAQGADIYATQNHTIKWGQEIQVTIRHLLGVTIRRVGWQGVTIKHSRATQTTAITEPLHITPDLQSNRLDLRLSLEKNGQRCTVRRKLDLKIIGAKHLTIAGWRALNRHSTITTEQAKRDLFKINLPSTGTQSLKVDELFLFEGDGAYHHLPRRDAPLGELHGWGAPLRVRPLFNAKSATLELAGSVIWHGKLDDAICEAVPNGTDQLLRLRFRQQIEPGKEHTIIWWDSSGEVITLKPKYCDEAEGAWWWMCELPEQCVDLLAVAVAYQGSNLGSWWTDREWLIRLRALNAQDAKRTAALLRWFHLPMLGADALGELRHLIERRPADFLGAWLLDKGLPDGLASSGEASKDEVWLAVVRKLFHKWQPNADIAQQVLMTLAEVETAPGLREYLPDAAQRLCDVDPLLMAKDLRAWQDPQRRQIIQRLRLGFSGATAVASIGSRKQALLQAAGHSLGIANIYNGILARATQALQQSNLIEEDKNNLALAARFKDLRRLLALHLLEQI